MSVVAVRLRPSVVVAVALAVVVVVAVAVAFDVGSPSVAPCRRALKRIRCGVCLSAAQRSEFRRAPLQGPAARGPRAAGRYSRGRLFLVPYFGEAKEGTRPPGRTPGLSPR